MSLVKDLIQRRGAEDNLLADATLRHNVRSALRDLKLLSRLVAEGYAFDDEMASEHRQAFTRAVFCLEGYLERK